MIFPDASGVAVNMLPISDGSAFDQLKRLVDSEGENLAASVACAEEVFSTALFRFRRLAMIFRALRIPAFLANHYSELC